MSATSAPAPALPAALPGEAAVPSLAPVPAVTPAAATTAAPTKPAVTAATAAEHHNHHHHHNHVGCFGFFPTFFVGISHHDSVKRAFHTRTAVQDCSQMGVDLVEHHVFYHP